MINRVLLIKYMLIIVVLVLSSNVFSKSVVRYFPLKVAINKSEIIIVGNVKDVKNKALSRDDTVYFEPLQVISGEMKNKLIKVIIDAKEIVKDQSYVLFLENIDGEYYPFGGSLGYYHINEKGFVCNSNEYISVDDFVATIKKTIPDSNNNPWGDGPRLRTKKCERLVKGSSLDIRQVVLW